jgi:uncharacterized protein
MRAECPRKSGLLRKILRLDLPHESKFLFTETPGSVKEESMFFQSSPSRLTAPCLLLLATLFANSSRAQISDYWPPTVKMLVFHSAGGFRHASIDNGLAMFMKMDSLSRTAPSIASNFRVDFSEQSSIMDSAHLAGYHVLVLLQTTLPAFLFNEAQRKALIRFVERGGGLVAIHGALDVRIAWNEYDALLGTSYAGSRIQDRRTLRHHSGPTAKILANGLAGEIGFEEEWNSLRPFPASSGMDTINSVPDSGLFGMEPKTGTSPVSWTRKLPSGRVFGTVLGHNGKIFSDCYFVRLMRNAILWTAHAEWSIPVDASKPSSPECPVSPPTAEHPFPGARISSPSGFLVTRGDGALRVTMLLPGAHVVSLRTLDGKLLGTARGTEAAEHEFKNLRSGTVYALEVRRPDGRLDRKLILPGPEVP